jgi:protein TonB
LIIALVAALHIVLVYSIVSGLATRIALSAPSILTAEFLPPNQNASPPPSAPALPPLEQPILPTVPPPVIRVAPSQPTTSAITAVQGPPPPAPRPIATAAPPLVPLAPTAANAVAGTHTIPPYPDLARRLGTVQVRISLDATGAVRAMTVQRSSGSDTLDAAAVAWVQTHWRYHPATEGGRPVGSSVLANLVFDLKRAR